MFKKISILILVFTIILAGCSGAPELTAKETLDKMMEKQVEMDNVAAKIDMVMSIEFDESKMSDNPEAAEMLSMFENIKASLDFNAVDMKNDFKMNFDGSFDLNGMSMNIDGYIDKEMAAVNYPMMGKYITITYKDLFDLAKENGEAEIPSDIVERVVGDMNKVFVPKVIKYMTESFTEEDVKFVDDYVFMVDGEEVKEKAVVYTIAPDKMMDISLGMYKALAYDEEVYNTLKGYDIPDFPADFETFKAEFDKVFAEVENDEVQAEMKEAFEGMTYDIAMAYNDDFTTKYAKITVDMKIDTEDESVGEVGYKYDVDVVYNYKDVKVEKPQLNDENSMDFMMFLQGMMM